MDFIEIDDVRDGVRLHYRTDGDPSLPCLVLSNSLGTDLRMWDPQVAVLAQHYHVLRYDSRGHGRSERGAQPVTLERLGRDVCGLLAALNIPRAHFCGISMGGLTGQWLALHAPQRFASITLANTAARIGSAEAWRTRANLVRREGMGAVADGAAARWFTQDFIASQPGTVSTMIARLRETDPAGYADCCDALADADLRSDISAITLPLLIIAGEQDPVTTIADGMQLARQVNGAQLTSLPASHLSNIESPAAFTQLLLNFLNAQTS